MRMFFYNSVLGVKILLTRIYELVIYASIFLKDFVLQILFSANYK